MNDFDSTTQPTTPDVSTPQPVPSAQPAPQPTAPSAPQPAQPQPQPAQPAPQGQPQQAQAKPAPSIHARIFDKILQGMSGGPRRVINPDGSVSMVNDSKSSMGKAIVAAALTGLMTPSHYRDTPFGPVNDYSADMAGAAEAGQKTIKNFQQEPQRVSDEIQSRKLATVRNNMQLTQQAAAFAHQGNSALDDVVKSNQQYYLAPVEEYENQRTADLPSAYADDGKGGQLKNLTVDQLLQGGKFKPTDHNVIVDGVVPVRNPQTGVMENHPTYAVLNPDLKLKLNEDTVKELSKFNKSFENVYAATGGNVTLPINQYMRAVHTANTLTSVEDYLTRATQDIFGNKAKPTDLAAAVKKNPNLFASIDAVEKQLAAGHDAKNVDPTRNGPEAILDAVRNTKGGEQLLQVYGLDPKTVDKYIEDTHNEKLRSQALAKEGGMGPKAPMPDSQVDTLLSALDNSNIPKETKDTVRAGAKKDKDGHYNLNMMQGEDLRNRILTAQNQTNQINEKNLLANGDPAQMTQTAQNTVEGDVNDITKIASMRGNARTNAVNAMHNYAASLGLDTTNYSEAALDSQAQMWKDYTGGQKTPTGKQLVSFDGFIGHVGDAMSAQQRVAGKYLGLYHQPILNKTMKELGAQLTDDPDWAAYTASLEPVKHEISNFLAAGFATKSEDADAMRSILSDTMPIDHMNATLKQLSMTADIRLAALGKAYTNNMGRNYDHLLSPESQKTLEKLGVQSQAMQYTAKLPHGWSNHQFTQLKDVNVAKQFLKAAGGDKNAARELMKRNGWSE